MTSSNWHSKKIKSIDWNWPIIEEIRQVLKKNTKKFFKKIFCTAMNEHGENIVKVG